MHYRPSSASEDAAAFASSAATRLSSGTAPGSVAEYDATAYSSRNSASIERKHKCVRPEVSMA
jgi:hypothetical protein